MPTVVAYRTRGGRAHEASPETPLPTQASSDPARSAKVVTPSNTVALDPVPRALYVGVGGTLVLRGVDDTQDTTWENVPAGTLLPFRAQYVKTGTTAASILALY